MTRIPFFCIDPYNPWSKESLVWVRTLCLGAFVVNLGLVVSARKTRRHKIGLDSGAEAGEPLCMSPRTPRRVLCPLSPLGLLSRAAFAAPGVAVLLVATDRVAGPVDERVYGQFLEE